jgi:hypothetical protein
MRARPEWAGSLKTEEKTKFEAAACQEGNLRLTLDVDEPTNAPTGSVRDREERMSSNVSNTAP